MSVTFSHPNVGILSIDNGIDTADWSYNLNTQSYPTYGGEVVQILSVFIDDLTVGGSCSTYSQMEAIYSYFANYLQIATQGTSGTGSYNETPMTFTYPARGWNFSIQPKTAPGFGYGWDRVLATWEMTAHIVDESGVDTASITAAIKDAAVTAQMSAGGLGAEFSKMDDEISPVSGDPNTDPFQTYTQGQTSAVASLHTLSDYYRSMVAGYQTGSFTSITGGQGASPTASTTTSTAATAAQVIAAVG